VLGLSIDTVYETIDEKILIDGVPFIAQVDFIAKHGTAYSLEMESTGEVILKALDEPLADFFDLGMSSFC